MDSKSVGGRNGKTHVANLNLSNKTWMMTSVLAGWPARCQARDTEAPAWLLEARATRLLGIVVEGE